MRARLLALLAGATMLAGCDTTNQDAVTGRIPTTIASAIRSVHQGRAAHGRAVHRQQARRPRRRATRRRASPSRTNGGARRPAASSSTCRPAPPTHAPPPARCTKSAAILAAAGVPPNGIAVRPYQPARSAQARDAAHQLSADRWPRPARADCGPTISGRPIEREHCENREYWNLGCAIAAQSRRHGRQSGRPGAAARRNAALHRPPHHRARQVSATAKAPRQSIRTPTKARSATSANDAGHASQTACRTCQRRRRGRRQRAYRAGAARLGAGLLRDGRDRRRRPGRRRRPASRQGASQDPDGRHRGRRRGLPQLADAQCHHASSRTAAATISRRPRHARGVSATPAPASS